LDNNYVVCKVALAYRDHVVLEKTSVSRRRHISCLFRRRDPKLAPHREWFWS
jgi:hypothetical protein